MNEQNHPSNQESKKTEVTRNEGNSGRRAAFKQSGLLLGAALLGGSGKNRVAQADHHTSASGTMSGNNQDMPMDSSMQTRLNYSTSLTARNEMGIPRSGVVAQSKNPGRREQNDVMILTYALALEYLEADFYTRVVAADNARPFLRGRVKDLARVLARDETTHVQAVSDAIRALGGTPIPKPAFIFPNNAFISPIGFLVQSSDLEETGVSAYLGQGANVQRRDVLNFAASIYGNEARHSALIRHHLGDNIARHDREMPRSMAEILEKVRPFFADANVLTTLMPGMMNGSTGGNMAGSMKSEPPQ